MVRRVLCYAWPEPTWLDSALRTTTPAPIIGAHQPIPCPGLTPHCGQPRRHPSLAHTHEIPAAKSPGGTRPANEGPHRSRGQQQRRCLLRDESRVPDVEYARVHRRTRPPLLDQQRTHNNPRPVQTPHCGQPRRHPSLVRTHESPGCNSALRTTAPAPTMGAHPRTT